MRTSYQVKGWIKYYEEDTYKEGCIGEVSMQNGNDTFEAKDLKELIESLKSFCNCNDNDSLMFNSCDEIGRLDIQVIETNDSYTPSKEQMRQWKKGNFRIWACTYSFNIELVHSEAVDLNNALAIV